jgi:hypothetical protein
MAKAPGPRAVSAGPGGWEPPDNDPGAQNQPPPRPRETRAEVHTSERTAHRTTPLTLQVFRNTASLT